MTSTLEGSRAASGGPIRRSFGRKKFDKQPTQAAAVLLAAPFGDAIPPSAVRAAVKLSDGAPVAVVTIARIYGSSLGLPNPGLMPTRKEMDAQKTQIEKTVRHIEKLGVEAWGQIAASRKPIKTIVEAAKARGVRHVMVVRKEQEVKWRAVVEGNIVHDIAKKMGPDVQVEGITP